MFRTWLGWLFIATGVFNTVTLFVGGWNMVLFNLVLVQVLLAVEYLSNPKGVNS